MPRDLKLAKAIEREGFSVPEFLLKKEHNNSEILEEEESGEIEI